MREAQAAPGPAEPATGPRRAAGWISLAFVAALALAAPAAAQMRDHKGTDFWIAFPLRSDSSIQGGDEVSLTILSDVATSGSVEIPGTPTTPGTTVFFAVAAKGTTTVNLPLDVLVSTADGVERKGIHVTAGAEVSVVALNRRPGTSDAFLALPTDALGTEYITLTWPTPPLGASFGLASELAVLAVEDATAVTIDPRGDALWTMTLNRGEVFQFRDQSDITSGARVTADKPIAVYGANTCAFIVREFCNHIVEQMWPTATWGTKFVVFPLFKELPPAPRQTDQYRIVAAKDDTHVGGVTLGARDIYTFSSSAPVHLAADKPIQVAQFSEGDGSGTFLGDPFMMLLPPAEQFLEEYVVESFDRPGFTYHFINVVVPSEAAASVTIDGVAPLVVFAAIGSSGYLGAQIVVSPGRHVVKADAPIGVWAYGYGDDDGYGYPAGGLLGAIDRVTRVSVLPETAARAPGTEHCVTATVSEVSIDRDHAISITPIDSVRVLFTVTGPNATSGSAISDHNGEARFCYVGTTAGTDSIAAAAGGIVDPTPAAVSWASADVEVTAGVAPAVAVTGSTVTYSITVSNHGPNDATGVETTVAVPSGITIQSCSGEAVSCLGTGSERSVRIKRLRDGSGETFTVVGVVNCALSDSVALAAHVVATADVADPDPTNNAATALLVTSNPPPVIACPANVTVANQPGQCSAAVAIGSATATDNCSGVTVTAARSDGAPLDSAFSVAETAVLWTARDAGGATASCGQTVTVRDVEPPMIAVTTPDGQTLWPPNHRMVELYVAYEAADNCGDGSGASCSLMVSSSEPVEGTGDGDTAPDWEVVDAHRIRLRAERAGAGRGRVYTVTVLCTDRFENATSRAVTFVVPHDRGRRSAGR